jgi:hypothetical protein
MTHWTDSWERRNEGARRSRDRSHKAPRINNFPAYRDASQGAGSEREETAVRDGVSLARERRWFRAEA